jgi:uncharacterized membrane protein YdjX (TVP38/TMEM64 family)
MQQPRNRMLWRLLALAGFAGLLLLAYATGVTQQLSWSNLAARQAALHGDVAANPAASGLAYIAIYTAVVAISVPGGAILTMAGGLLFGTAAGAALAVTGATIGATLLFLLARTALAPLLTRRAEPFLARLRPDLERDGFAALLALRLIPVVPFWLVNLAPALVGMRLRPYIAATAIGVIPATVVFASVGAGLGDVLAHGGRPDPSLILSPPVLLPLLGLAVLSLAPALWRRWKDRYG